MTTRTLIPAFVLCLATTPVLAQETGSDLSSDAAERFIQNIGEEADSAVESGDWQGMADWVSQHVSDEAPVAMEGDFTVTGGPTGSYMVSMTGAQLAQMAQMKAQGPMQMHMGGAITDYDIVTEVLRSWQVPGGMVGMTVAFYETGRLDPAKARGAAAGTGEQAGQSQTASEAGQGQMDHGFAGGAFSTASMCTFRLGGAGEEITIEAVSCKASSMM